MKKESKIFLGKLKRITHYVGRKKGGTNGWLEENQNILQKTPIIDRQKYGK